MSAGRESRGEATAPNDPIAPIAIVGMACRFAGARDLHGYWQMTREGRDGFGPVPPDRWPNDAFYDPNPRAADKSYCPRGGFIDDVRSFPAVALQVPPRRVEVMDPQQRMALELSVEAVEDAGLSIADLPHRTGVTMGVTAIEYRTLTAGRVIAQLMASGALGRAPEDPAPLAAAIERLVPGRPFTAPGLLANMIAATVAQELRVHGPAFTTDAACASALVAIESAVTALRTGAIDMAVSGGVYLCLTPEHHIAFSRIGAISKSGHCLPFDERADGFLQGDGCGVLILERASDAVAKGHRIYALIRGIASNNDGGGEGPMAPVRSGQIEVLRAAWRDAGLEPESLGYLEAHGTGTSVGDMIEYDALSEVFSGPGRDIVIGSSKANVGHTMSAAGVAGVIRAALAIHHRCRPPMANFERPKEGVDLAGGPFSIPTEPGPWEARRRVAAVSCFGFGGTNVHTVLSDPGAEGESRPAEQAELVLISAPDVGALRDLAGRTADAVEGDASITVAGVARAWAGRRRQAVRLGLVASTREQLVADLRAVAAGERSPSIALGEAVDPAEPPPKIAFLYPGQGAQRVGMLAGIRDRFPVVAETLAAADRELAGVMPLPVTHLLYPERRAEVVDAGAAMKELTDTENCQPALFAVGMALTRLLDVAGVRPAVVAGHSVGEFTAATAGGVLDLGEGARLVARRGRAMADMAGDRGAMVALVADRATAESLLVDGAVIANVNHPRQTVVSGASEAVAEVRRKAEAAGVRAIPLVVSHGFHSPVFSGFDLDAVVDALPLNEPAVPVASCIGDRPYTGAEDARRIFKAHATSPVLFTRTLEQCRELGAEIFLQVGAGGPLVSFARGTLGRGTYPILSLASEKDDDGGASLLACLAQLWVRGVEIDVSALAAPAPLASVPPSVLPREVYWAVKDAAVGKVKLAAGSTVAQPPDDTAAPTEPAAPASAASLAAERSVAEVVLAAVAKTSAYPKDALKPGMTLTDDLGFDSMMVADLIEELSAAVPGFAGIPRDAIGAGLTIADIIEYAERPRPAEAEATEADDDAPLGRFQPVWRPCPLPESARSEPRWGRIHLAGPGAPLLGQLAARLREGGASRVDDGPADLVIWAADPSEPLAVAAVLRGEAEAPDPSGALLALLAEQERAGATPELLLLRRDDDPWAEALTGAVRALSQERGEDALCRSLRLPAPPWDEGRVAELALAELFAPDATVDIRYDDEGARYALGTRAVAEPAAPWQPAADDVILITGGTRGIGLALASRLASSGARIVLLGRGEPSDEARSLMADHEGRIFAAAADVTDGTALAAALADQPPITALVHAAGLLADGPLAAVDLELGRKARAVKAEGLLTALVAAGPSLRRVLAIGSWAGRFGSRHQGHYAAGNALMSSLAAAIAARVERPRVVVSELGPWTSSAMVATIPPAVRAAMRLDGVDFVGDEAGLAALLEDLGSDAGPAGPIVRGRRVPATTRRRASRETLSVETHPFLADHAIDGRPVLPLASAAATFADLADLAPAPWAVEGLTLYQGVVVSEPLPVTASIAGERAELHAGERHTLAYRARVRLLDAAPDELEASQPPPLAGGEAPELPLAEFYGRVTFHGPLLQGITAIDGVGEDFVRGRVRVGDRASWIPAAGDRPWLLSPLALDSAMQLSAYVAWTRYHRAGTPLSIGRYVQLRPLPGDADAELIAEVRFGEREGDRFTGSIYLRDPEGALLAFAEDVVAQLREVGAEDAEAAAPEAAPGDEAPFTVDPAWIDPAQWPEYQALKERERAAAAAGLANPYFDLHDGTARNTSSIEGREVINYSSYNYLGLSGDPRIRADVAAAMERWGTSVSASRVASGERAFHRDLERGLADTLGVEDALVFPSGHATNVTTIGHLFGPKDLICHDELIHDSCLQGIKLSGAARRGFRHDDPEHLEQQLRPLRRHYEKVLILIEGVYSMDGDIAELPRYLELKERYGCLLMIDEAHSFGTIGETGRGIGQHFGVDPTRADIWMGTLSKSFASMGGYIAGRHALVEYLRFTAPGFVYAAGMTPTLGQAALSALRLMHAEPWRVERLQRNARTFYEALRDRGIDTGDAVGRSPVVPAITGDSIQALMLSQSLLEQGINAKPIIFPAVAEDAARLRFFLTALHTDEQLVETAERIATTLAAIRAKR